MMSRFFQYLPVQVMGDCCIAQIFKTRDNQALTQSPLTTSETYSHSSPQNGDDAVSSGSEFDLFEFDGNDAEGIRTEGECRSEEV
jgi:hypothetical protein